MKQLLLFTLVLFLATTAKAQPPARILFNSGFEEPVVRGDASDPNNTTTGYRIIDENLVPGWNVETDTRVEVWRNGFTTGSSPAVFAQDGRQHIELNANNPSNVLLDVCLLNAETVTLVFHHRAREGNGAVPISSRIDVMEVAAFNQVSGNIVMSNIVATNVPDALGTPWVGSGTIGTTTANSFEANSPTQGWTRFSCDMTNTGASGTCRVRFRGVGGGSFGNFIDNIQIGGLNPLTEFQLANYSDIEGTGGNQPRLIINGRVDVASTVDVLVQNGAIDPATNPADYTTVGTVTVNIPAGDYDGTWVTGISLSLGIIDDNDHEPDETIRLSYVMF